MDDQGKLSQHLAECTADLQAEEASGCLHSVHEDMVVCVCVC